MKAAKFSERAELFLGVLRIVARVFIRRRVSFDSAESMWRYAYYLEASSARDKVSDLPDSLNISARLS